MVDEVVKKSESFMKHVDGFLEMNNKESGAVAAGAKKASISTQRFIGVFGDAAVIVGVFLPFLL